LSYQQEKSLISTRKKPDINKKKPDMKENFLQEFPDINAQ